MIPKIIHYCWFSGDELPVQAQKCIESWRKWMPEYEIRKWTLADFDVNSVKLTKEALETKKWAFLTDYVRQYALYHVGGIYMDSDVMLYRSLEPLIKDGDRFISGNENRITPKYKAMLDSCLDKDYNRICKSLYVPGMAIQAALLVSEKGHPLPKECMDYYGTSDLQTILDNYYVAPAVVASRAEKYGYKYIDQEQFLSEGIHIYPSSIISNFDQKTKKSIAVHWCAGSWVDQTFIGSIKYHLNRNRVYRFIRDIVNTIIVSIKK